MKSSKKNKILFIEDDPVLLGNVREILEEEGFEVKTEIDGARGIKTVFDWLPDLIICDISIPLKNGYEVLQEILKSDITKNIPFIFLTAKVERDDIRKGMQLGADDYIFKPFEIEDLLNSVKLRLKKSSRNVEVKTEIVEAANKEYEMDDKILVKTGNKMQLCPIRELKFLRAENPYVHMKFINGKSSLQRQTLDDWEVRLPNKYFIRIHRATIINTEYITKIERLSKTSYIIRIKDEEEPFVISKRYSSKIKERFA